MISESLSLAGFFEQHAVRDVRFQVSVFSPAAGQKTAGQIEKETDERRTSNVE